MKKALVFILILSISSVLFAQQKFALVIGNARYTGISPLSNPENDANDMEAALRSLGFTVTKVLNGSRVQMETAVVNFRQRLGASANTYGFFFYAGHGIQSNGENYLIPVDANIPSENALRDRAVSLQWILAELNDARNELNIVVLDSCRNSPFSWSRSGTRGLTPVSHAPPGSIVFYATSAGRIAADGDGTGRNGLFTSNLLNSLRIPDLEINEVIRRTGAAVSQASGGTQIPAVYNQFFGTAYLGSSPSPSPSPQPTPVPDGLEYEVVNGRSVTITSYTGDATTLGIPAQIQGLMVTEIGYGAFNSCRSLTSVTIPSSVTSIGDYAFYYCDSLTSVTIPSSVTSIGDLVFSYCMSLTNITVDSRNPAYASIDGVLFDKSIRTIIAYPRKKTARTYTIPSSVTSIGNSAFYFCYNLTSLTIPSSVMYIGDSAFSRCSLTSVTLPSSVTSIGDGVFSCSDLTSVTIPSSVTSIGDRAFAGCSSLTSVTIPSSVTSIGDLAFAGCSSLTSITIPSSVTSIGSAAFAEYGGDKDPLYCSSLTNITVDSRNPAYASIDGVLFDKNIRTIISYPAGKITRTYIISSSVTSIGDWAFSYCSSLTSVTIPTSVTSIGNSAFRYCNSLTSVTIPSSVRSIGERAFSDCSSLTSVTIPSSVRSIGERAFYGCRSLTSITIPSSVNSIGDYAFSFCISLTSVAIPSSVNSIGEEAFLYCSSLISVTIPSSVTSIGDQAFAGCSSLTSITVDNRNPAYASIDGVLFDKNIRIIIAYPAGKITRTYTIPSSVTAIGNGAFMSCSSLTSVTIPSSVRSIGEEAFAYCRSLTSITIPSSVTSIGNGAFEDCRSLTSVTIPSSVTSIGDSAFRSCSSLTSVTLSRRTQVGDYYAFPETARITYRD